jgi:hypothetical protein
MRVTHNSAVLGLLGLQQGRKPVGGEALLVSAAFVQGPQQAQDDLQVAS